MASALLELLPKRLLLAAACSLLGCAAPRAAAPGAVSPPANQAANGELDEAEPAPEVDPGAFEGCAAHLDDAPARELDVAGRKAVLQGYRLRFTSPDADGRLVLGVLGPIDEGSGLNLLAIRKYVQFFAQEKADAIVVNGDVGEVSSGIARVLEELSASRLPILVVSGNSECKEDFFEGVSQAQRSFDGIVNLNAVREVELPGLTLVSLPGYHDPNYITCETGCRYDKTTVDEVISVARRAQGPVLLVSHGPPRGRSSQSVDFTPAAGNTGDAEINRALREGHIAFGVFSNIKEAGARATELDGATLIQQGQASKSLYLNPGPADTSQWEMNDHSKSYGFAAVLAFDGPSATWKLFRAPKPTQEEKKAAKALEQLGRPLHPDVRDPEHVSISQGG